MKVGIVRASDLVRESRWDAGFHIARSELDGAMTDLARRYTDEQAIEIVDGLPLSEKAALEALRMGSRRRAMGRDEARTLTRRYPHLALALVARDADASILRIRQQIATGREALERMIELSENRVARLDHIAGGDLSN